MSGCEGAKAASDDSHRPELCPGLVHHIGTGGALLTVVPIPPLEVVVRAGNRHLHDGANVEAAKSETERKKYRWDSRRVNTASKSVLFKKSLDSAARRFVSRVCVRALL